MLSKRVRELYFVQDILRNLSRFSASLACLSSSSYTVLKGKRTYNLKVQNERLDLNDAIITSYQKSELNINYAQMHLYLHFKRLQYR